MLVWLFIHNSMPAVAIAIGVPYGRLSTGAGDTTPGGASDVWLMEDLTSGWLMEDGTSFWLIES